MIQESKNGVRIRLYVQPNGKRNEIIGEYDGALKIRIQAAPVEGQANAAVTEFVAKLFAVPRSRVSLVRGMQSRLKVIEITGIDIASARLKLASAL